jgi:hypothetical protein
MHTQKNATLRLAENRVYSLLPRMVRPVGVEPTQDAVPETAALSTELRARDDLYYRTYFKHMQMQKMENGKKSFEGRGSPAAAAAFLTFFNGSHSNQWRSVGRADISKIKYWQENCMTERI